MSNLTNILVIEDDAEKLRRVVKCLLEQTGVDRDRIHDARDVNAAKRLMKQNKYDLLILDIAVPERADELPSHEAGIALLREILDRDIYFVPTHIVGLTAHQDALDAAVPCFDEVALHVIRYDAASSEWAERLRRVVKRIILAERGTGVLPEHGVHLCIVTALATPELEAVLALPWAWEEFETATDPTAYYKGKIEIRGTTYEVVAAAAPRMGMTASAVLATKMVMTFRPRYLAMTGILAGIEGECELGDILVADPGWDYESGKRTVRDGQSTFSAAPHQIVLDPFLRNKLVRASQDHAALDTIRRSWRGEPRLVALSMRLGPVASGAAVLEDPAVVEGIKKQHRKTLGVEMETYGVLMSADESPSPQPRAFSIKSVCDFADPRKNNDHQRYAAYTSASALRLLVEKYL